MKDSCICFALELALTAVIAAVSADAYAADASGTVRATVIAPVPAGNTLETFSSGTFVGGVTSDLTIHMPGLSQPPTPEHLNSVPFELFSTPDSVCAGCLAPEGEYGLLQGDPVHDIVADAVTHSTSGEDGVRLSLNYN